MLASYTRPLMLQPDLVKMCILFAVAQVTVTTDCPALTPPSMGLLKCQTDQGTLRCLATCFNGQEFDTGEEVVLRTCDEDTGQWIGGNDIPVCHAACQTRLLRKYDRGGVGDHVVVTASTDIRANDVIPLMERASLGNPWNAVWRPEVDDLAQFIQVDLPGLHRINGVALRGDGTSGYVTSLRLLFSEDGITWYPYTDGTSSEVFIRGSTNSREERVIRLHCPHEARHVRLNPITWSGHVALAFDLIGCPIDHAVPKCHPVPPPQGGVVNCEVDGQQIFCTGYCEKGKVFEGPESKPVISTTCNVTSGQFDTNRFPPCIDGKSPSETISVFCLEQELDCDDMTNGDYQYCGDCHYFSTCSHGYFYVRACPALLQFDSVHNLCDYKSRTCSSFRRRYWLADRRMRPFNDITI